MGISYRRARSVVTFATLFVGFLSPCYLNTATAQTTYADRILADEPFAYWRMDESGIGGLSNLGTAAHNANHAGPVVTGVAGLADPDNAALRFSGLDDTVDPPVGGRVTIGDSIESNLGIYTEKTIEFWFSADNADTPDEQILYEQGGNTRAITIYVHDGKVIAGAHNSANDDGAVSSPWPAEVRDEDGRGFSFVSADIESNTPYHIAFVMDGDADGFDGTITGYLDGEMFGQVDGVGTLFAHSDDIALGGAAAQVQFENAVLTDPTFHYFEGVIDEFAMYNRALSGPRIGFHLGADLSGDINGDGSVDTSDFMILAGNFNAAGTFEQGDINFDDFVDMSDFFAWRQIFQSEGGAAAAAVPEPSTNLLVLCGMLALTLLRRRVS